MNQEEMTQTGTLVEVDAKVATAVDDYKSILMEYNKKINLISRQITNEMLEQLLDETFFLEKYISFNNIVDAGSGNGLLGIPIAIKNKNKKIVLVEPKKKKFEFLAEVKNQMELFNVSVCNVSIEEYLKNNKKKQLTLIARGFPDLSVFCGYLKKSWIKEAVLFTSLNKIKKNKIHLESVNQKTYNVPLRNFLKILKIIRMENTARGYKEKM